MSDIVSTMGMAGCYIMLMVIGLVLVVAWLDSR